MALKCSICSLHKLYMLRKHVKETEKPEFGAINKTYTTCRITISLYIKNPAIVLK